MTVEEKEKKNIYNESRHILTKRKKERKKKEKEPIQNS
jgi:hypothetical protein